MAVLLYASYADCRAYCASRQQFCPDATVPSSSCLKAASFCASEQLAAASSGGRALTRAAYLKRPPLHCE